MYLKNCFLFHQEILSMIIDRESRDLNKNFFFNYYLQVIDHPNRNYHHYHLNLQYLIYPHFNTKDLIAII